MANMQQKCRMCHWWDPNHERIKHAPEVPGITKPGFCRKHRPAAYMLENYHIGIQPIMDSEEGCAEYRPGETNGLSNAG